MKDQLIGLITLCVILSGMFLRSAAKVLIAMGVLWLTGKLFPVVAQALGLPEPTFFHFVVDLVGVVVTLIVAALSLIWPQLGRGTPWH